MEGGVDADAVNSIHNRNDTVALLSAVFYVDGRNVWICVLQSSHTTCTLLSHTTPRYSDCTVRIPAIS